jgi:hypothetical protein
VPTLEGPPTVEPRVTEPGARRGGAKQGRPGVLEGAAQVDPTPGPKLTTLGRIAPMTYDPANCGTLIAPRAPRPTTHLWPIRLDLSAQTSHSATHN